MVDFMVFLLTAAWKQKLPIEVAVIQSTFLLLLLECGWLATTAIAEIGRSKQEAELCASAEVREFCRQHMEHHRALVQVSTNGFSAILGAFVGSLSTWFGQRVRGRRGTSQSGAVTPGQAT